MEGQKVNVNQNGELTVDGVVFHGSYGTTVPSGTVSQQLPVVVPKGCVFLVNDNREATNDSRNAEVGCVDKSKVIGIILMRIGFFGRVGS